MSARSAPNQLATHRSAARRLGDTRPSDLSSTRPQTHFATVLPQTHCSPPPPFSHARAAASSPWTSPRCRASTSSWTSKWMWTTWSTRCASTSHQVRAGSCGARRLAAGVAKMVPARRLLHEAVRALRVFRAPGRCLWELPGCRRLPASAPSSPPNPRAPDAPRRHAAAAGRHDPVQQRGAGGQGAAGGGLPRPGCAKVQAAVAGRGARRPLARSPYQCALALHGAPALGRGQAAPAVGLASRPGSVAAHNRPSAGCSAAVQPEWRSPHLAADRAPGTFCTPRCSAAPPPWCQRAPLTLSCLWRTAASTLKPS